MFKLPIGKKQDKNEGFKLDDYSIPSMGGGNVAGENMSSGNFDSSSSSLDLTHQNNQIPNSFSDQQNSPNSFQQPFGNSNESFSSSPNSFQQANQFQGSNSGYTSMGNDNELIKAKVESMEGKLALIDTKVSTMNQKLDVIYKILMAEISDETKRKLKVGDMMDTVRNNN